MKLIFHPDAEREFHEGIRQYLLIDPALGADFEAKVEEAVALAMSFPDAWREIRPGIRRCLVRRFPYGVLYSYDEDVFYIAAVMHLHAKPGYWRKRLKDSPIKSRRANRRNQEG